MIDQAFQCEACGAQVEESGQTARNHCPECLTSKHVDENPGDRSHSCQGLMDAVGYKLSSKKGIVLTFRCGRCGQLKSNKAFLEGYHPDNYERILSLTPSDRHLGRF